MLKLLDSGMCVARINLSHGNIKTNARIMRKFVEAKRLRPHKTCALMVELRGREIRTSDVDSKEFPDGIPLRAG